jgi:hypothetical protein
MNLDDKPLDAVEEIQLYQVEGFNNYWAKQSQNGGWGGCSRDEADLFIIRSELNHDTVPLPWPACRPYLKRFLKALELATTYGEHKRAQQIRFLLQFNK